MDTLGPAEAGRAVVPSTTPSGFEILAAPGGLTIGARPDVRRRLLVENHGVAPTVWDPRLAEVTGTAAISFFEQPYLPFNDAVADPPADVFNRPVLAGGPHLVYLDVWQREVTYARGSRAGREGGRRRHHDAAADGLAGAGARRCRRRHDLRDADPPAPAGRR